MINEQIYHAAIQLMAALIAKGEFSVLKDTDHDYYNKYCIQKAIALQKMVTDTKLFPHLEKQVHV